MSSLLSILAIISTGAGIVFLWLILRKFFAVPVALITSFLILFGTNYFRWNFFEGSTPHNFLFTLFACMLLLTLNWQRDQKWIWLLLMLPVTLLACFIHDLAVFILLFPLLCGIHDRGSWIEVKKRAVHNPLQYVFLLLMIVAVFVLTRFSWFAEPGTKFYYGDPKASVYPFLAANFQLILFSFKKGWLIYTPMMLLVLPGMYFLAEKARGFFYSVFFFFSCWFLLASSHSLWAADAGFGQRFFIETYAVLALPLGFFIEWVWNKKLTIRILLLVFPAFFLFLNLFQTWQFGQKIIVPEMMNRKVYFAVFGQTSVSLPTVRLMEMESGRQVERMPRNTIFRITRLANFGFEGPVPEKDRANIFLHKAHSGEASLRLSAKNKSTTLFKKSIGSLLRKDPVWIRVTAWIFFECPPTENKLKLFVYCNHADHAFKWYEKNMAGLYAPGRWNKIVVDWQVPSEFPNATDKIEARFYYSGTSECLVDDFSVDFFEPAVIK